MTIAHVDAIFIPADSMSYQYRTRLAQLAAKRRLAYMSSNRETVVAGALVSLSANYTVLYERSAYYVDISKHVGRVNTESIGVDAVAA